jgi:hypothetical protein
MRVICSSSSAPRGRFRERAVARYLAYVGIGCCSGTGDEEDEDGKGGGEDEDDEDKEKRVEDEAGWWWADGSGVAKSCWRRRVSVRLVKESGRYSEVARKESTL